VRTLRFIRRCARIGASVFYWWLFFSVGWLAMILTLRPRARRRAFFGACLLGLFRGLGATFIKVGQIMSTRPDLLPPHVIHALEKLQDSVGPFPFADVERTLTEELGQPVGDVFLEISPTPVASASVSQVHRATLRSGEVVAVKVRRPRIEQVVDFDLSFMRGFARLLSIPRSIRLLAPVESVDEFGRGIRMQLDFKIEASNNRRFRKNFAADPDVLFPALYEDFCTERVLTMEFIDGVKVLDFGKTEEDPERLAHIGFHTLLKMIFEDGFVHADLHPGNIFITRAAEKGKGKVALLDVGLVGELGDGDRKAFARYFAAWAQCDGKTMAHIMMDLSPSKDILDRDGFVRAVEDFVRRYFGKKLGEVQVAVVFFDMLNILRKFRVRVNPTFTLMNIAIAVTEGIGKQLKPDIDIMTEALPFFARFNFFQG
jgi:ubiquinone biosynthesis protein